MAIPFNSSTIGDVPMMKPGQGGGAALGYNQPMTVDPSIIDQMQTAGFQVNATSYTSAYALSAFRPTQLEVLPGKLAPAFYDQGGSNYIINGNDGRVFLVTRSPVNPDGTTSTGGGQPAVSQPLMSGVSSPVPAVMPPGLVNGINPQPYLPPPPGGGGPTLGPGPARPAMGAGLGSGKIYSTFAVDDIIPNQQEIVTRAMWSKNVDELTEYYTSSIYTDEQKQYFYEIYGEDPDTSTDCEIEPQFSIAYGHIEGSGSAPVGSAGANTNDSPTRAVYNQYRLLCLEPDETGFTFRNDGTLSKGIFVININRARFREAVDEGNLEITINGNTYIDDSTENPAVYKQGSEVYKIVSGSLEDGIDTTDVDGDSKQIVYGLLFRRKGIIVLDARAEGDDNGLFDITLNLTVEEDGKNALKLFGITTSATGQSFKARSAERVKSTHFFVRAKNADYNFSNNPTFVTGSEGELLHPEMYNDPKTYITTVGLYNPSKELVAVAKLSQPIQKSFKEEALIKIKLDF